MLSVRLANDMLEVRFEAMMESKEFRYAIEFLQALGGVQRADKAWIIPKHRVDDLNKIFEDKLAWFHSIEDIKGVKQVALPKFHLTAEGLEDLKLAPFPFQMVGISFLHDVKCGLLADEMGLGKTPQAIGAIHRLHKEGKVNKVLVVCPTSLKYQWASEIEKFTSYQGVVIDGLPAARQKQYQQWQTTDALFALINYELVRNDLEILKKLNFDAIIADEVHRVRNWSSKTSAAIKELNAEYKFGLTGTPMQNAPEELYNLFDFLNPLVLGNWWAFRKRYVVTGEKFGQKGVTIGYRNLDELRRRVGPYMLRRMKKEVAPELPEMIFHNYTVEMTTVQTRLHEQMREDLLELLKEISQWHMQNSKRMDFEFDEQRPQHPKEGQSMGFFTMMVEVCDTPELLVMSDAGMAKHYSEGLHPGHVTSPKLNELVEIVKDQMEQGKEKIVIFTQFTRMQELIVDRLKPYGKCEILNGSIKPLQRQEAVDRFHYDNEVRFFVSTDAGNYGINLQFANTLIHMDMPWNPAIYDQRCGRVHRIGSSFKEVDIINLISRGGIDEQIQQVLYKKRELAGQVVEKSNEEKAIMHKLTSGLMKDLIAKPKKKKKGA